jgi:sugar phosphate permease
MDTDAAPPSLSQPLTGAPPASLRIRRTQQMALVLLVLSGALNYVDRATLAVANPLVRHDLGISIQGMGLLLSAFLWAYAFSQLPAGILVDRLGPRRVLSTGLALWSAAQVLGGLVAGFGQFFAARLLLGVGESPQSPASARVVRDWFNIRARGTATGIWNCSSTLGSAIAVPLLTVLMLHFGWRWMFALMGITGLGLAGALYALHRDPGDATLKAAERAHLEEGDAPSAPVTLREWRQLFTFRTTWGMIAGFFGCIYVLWIYNAWLPGYLETDRHMSIARTGWISAIPFLFGVAGSLVGGRLVDWLVARGVSPINSRKYPFAAALLGTALFTVLAAEISSNAFAVGCISISMFLIYVSTATAWAMAPVAAPGNCTASLGAMQNFGGYVGGALAPTVTGIIGQATGSFRAALLTGAVVAAVAAVAYAVVIKDAIPPQQEATGGAAMP